MKILILLAIVCSFWIVSAIPDSFNKSHGCNPTIISVRHVKNLVGVFYAIPSNCVYTSKRLKYSIDDKIMYVDNIPGILGVVELPDTLSCESDVKVSITVYGEDDLELGESDIVNIPLCEECAAIMYARYDSDDMKIVVSTTIPTSNCIAASFKLKCAIDNKTIYVDVDVDALAQFVELTEPLSCKAELSVVAYDDDGSELMESDVTVVRTNECKM